MGERRHQVASVYWSPLQGFPGHRRFTIRTLREALESAGLAIVRAETLRGVIPIGYVEVTFARSQHGAEELAGEGQFVSLLRKPATDALGALRLFEPET